MRTFTSATDSNQFYLILGISLGILLFAVLVYVSYTLIKRRNKILKEPKVKKEKIKQPKIKKQVVKEEIAPLYEIPHVYDLFGGKNNVVAYEQKGSRLVLELNDVDVINVEEIKKEGVDKILTMSKKITLIGSGISNLLNNLQNF